VQKRCFARICILMLPHSLGRFLGLKRAPFALGAVPFALRAKGSTGRSRTLF
jgi:hypothetical protein